jgi:hypothetical protein
MKQIFLIANPTSKIIPTYPLTTLNTMKQILLRLFVFLISVQFIFAQEPPALDGMFIINEDFDHFYITRTPEQMTLEGLNAFVDQYAGTKVTHLFLNPNTQRANFQSQSRGAVWESINDGVGMLDSFKKYAENAKLLHERGLDPYKIWIDRCREKKISPWISMRMNDLHGVHIIDSFLNTTFWRTHPQYWRIPNDKTGDWDSRAFNYAHPEVREYQLAFVSELFERYDFDGLELDWMRFSHLLTPGKEREESVFLNEFIRNVRKLAKEWEQKRGHKIYLAARIPTDPDNALGLGMDAGQWAKEGLVDLLIPAPFYDTSDFDIPIERWRERLDTNKTVQLTEVALAPGIDYYMRGYPKENLCVNDLATLYGFVAAERFRGAKNIYLFNWMDGRDDITKYNYAPVNASDYRTLLEKGIGDDIVLHSLRRHPVSYRDTGSSRNIQLPKSTDKESSFTIQLGPKPATGKLWLILGLGANDSVKEAALSATLNGKKTAPATDAERKGLGPDVVRAVRFDCPLDTAQNGANTVTVCQESGSPQKIIWVELRVEP